MQGEDPDSGRVDWLDLGPAPDGEPPASGMRRRRWWYAAAAAMVVAALLLARTQHGRTAAESSRSPSTVSAHPSAVPSSGTPPAGTVAGGTVSGGVFGTSAPPRVTVTSLGRPLLEVPDSWELIGQGPGFVVRIQLRRGRITRTPVPDLHSVGSAPLIAGAGWVIVNPLDDVTGYLVPDGGPAEPLPTALRQASDLLPGPDPRHLWARTGTEERPMLSLIELDGHPSGVRVPIPSTAAVLASDGAGSLLMYGIGGMYDIGADGVHRITSGTLLAAGATRWLSAECDDRYRCATVVTDRASGARHTIDLPVGGYQPDFGRISPDGSTAALLKSEGKTSATSLHLVDLSTGADRRIGLSIRPDVSYSGGALVWSPDGRWLFVTDGSGRLVAVNRATGQPVELRAAVGPVDQVAFRDTAR